MGESYDVQTQIVGTIPDTMLPGYDLLQQYKHVLYNGRSCRRKGQELGGDHGDSSVIIFNLSTAVQANQLHVIAGTRPRFSRIWPLPKVELGAS